MRLPQYWMSIIELWKSTALVHSAQLHYSAMYMFHKSMEAVEKVQEPVPPCPKCGSHQVYV